MEQNNRRAKFVDWLATGPLRNIMPPRSVFDPVQFLSFCCVGVANTLVDFLVYFAASSFLPLSLSRVISWAVACTFSYAVNKRWVFRHKTGGATPALRFVIVNVLGLLLGLVILEILTRHFGWGRLLAWLATIPGITLGNYFGYKLWSLRKR